MDNFVTTTQAGEVLGIHKNDVCALIRMGKLKAKLHSVKGKGGTRQRPHYRILTSELQRYMRDLPDAIQSAAPPEANHRTGRKPLRKPRAGQVIEFVR